MNGLAVMLLCTIAQGGDAGVRSGWASGASRVEGTAADVTAQVVIIFDFNEKTMNVQENWTLRSGKTIPASNLKIEIPGNTRFLRADPEHSIGFKAEDNAITATTPLAPGDHELIEGYIYDLSGASVAIHRRFPFSMEHLRIVVPDVANLVVETSLPSQRRSHDINGHTFIFYDLPPLAAGSGLDITLDGLPSNTEWPRRLTAAAGVAIALWMIWALFTQRVPGANASVASTGVLSAYACRDQIVKAIEVLESERAEEKISPKKYERRYAELLGSLGEVLKEIDLEKHSSSS